MMDVEDLALQDVNGNTALCIAAAAGSLDIVQILVLTNKSLLSIRGGKDMTPAYMAVVLGQSEIAWHLYKYPESNTMFEKTDRENLFFSCISNGLYDLALELLNNDRTLATARTASQKYKTALHILARRPSAFGGSQSPGMWSRLIKSWNYEFLAALMSSYPELVWETDYRNRTIIHVAVLHRHASIFNLVHEIGSIKDVIVTYADDQGNNIVHMAAKLAPQNQLNLVSGVALQMHRELVWFEAVKRIVQPQYIEMENQEGKTPQELFTKEHRALMRQGESWMKDTATSCLLVATIIATVVFSAAFSIPGGTDDHTGKPNFLKAKMFLYFTIADGVALFSSSTAMLMFLFILTSRYAENDFLNSLPLKLMIGLTSLFISIASMMMAFSTAFYLSCQYESRWLSEFTFLFALVPVALFGFMQFPLEEEEEEEIEEELADVTFGDLEKARSNGSHVLLPPQPKDDNKNRPMEVSSKKPVSRFREVIQAPKKDKQLKSDSSKRAEAEILADHKKKKREKAKQGKQPFFIKKSDIRKN
ncbi:hypothetical protein ACLB2K_026252 [Fragaria x ananassa]